MEPLLRGEHGSGCWVGSDADIALWRYLQRMLAYEDALPRWLEWFDLSAGASEILGRRDFGSYQNFGSLSRNLDTPMSGVALTGADSPGIVASTRSLAFVKSRVGARGR